MIAFLIPRFLLIFPDGRLPSRRWRGVGFAQYVVLLGLVVAALEPGPLADLDYKALRTIPSGSRRSTR